MWSTLKRAKTPYTSSFRIEGLLQFDFYCTWGAWLDLAKVNREPSAAPRADGWR